jgi:amino acid transporter
MATLGREAGGAESQELAAYGYRQELGRVLGFFSNFGVAFSYLSPVVGIYSLYVLGLGTGGPAYIWTILFVVAGQLLVALVFAELGSSIPLAGALFQWTRRLVGNGYGWWTGWFYAWALVITVASVDTGFVPYIATLLNEWFGTHVNPTSPNDILYLTLILLAIQTTINVIGVRFTGLIARYGVWVEVLGTFGVFILLAAFGFHRSAGVLVSSLGAQHAHTNPLAVNFHGSWFPAAAVIAVLANVYIFYGFESAADVSEEVVHARRHVPRAIVWTMVVGCITSFVLVAGFDLALPRGGGFAKTVTGGLPFLFAADLHHQWLVQAVFVVVVLAFFSCGTSVQAAGARVLFSYSRDRQLPGSPVLSRVTRRFRTPVPAILVCGVIPALFALLARINPSKPIRIGFITYPAHVNALFVLVSFATSGIYLSFLMTVAGALTARLRGWRPRGFSLGRFAYPIYAVALCYQIAVLLDIIFPSGLSSPRGLLFNYDWLTLAVMVLIAVVGLVVFALYRPAGRVARAVEINTSPARAAVPATPAGPAGRDGGA